MDNGYPNGDKPPVNPDPRPSPINGQRPPVEYQFKKGCKPGPGRPPGTLLTDRLRKVLDKQVPDKHGNLKSVAEAVCEAGVKAALSGDFRFWEAIFNRMDGKMADRLAGPDGGPVRFASVQFNVDVLRNDPEARAAIKLLAEREAAHLIEHKDDDEFDEATRADDEV